MKSIKVLHMYPDILDLYGDRGNIACLAYRTKMREISFLLDTCTLGEERRLSDYDLVFIGGGADREQHIVAGDLVSRKPYFEEAMAIGTQFLLICGAYQLFGNYYVDAAGNRLEGLGLGDYHTVSGGTNRCIGDVLIRTELDGLPLEIIGFENHGGQTFGVETPFGRVISGHGNQHTDHPEQALPERMEGYRKDGVIGTYLHGPLLPKNPGLSDYLIQKAVLCRIHRDRNQSGRTVLSEVQLDPTDDFFEKKAFEIMHSRLISK